MLKETSFFDILVKTLKNEAKSHKKLSGVSHSEALDFVSREYGFNHWKNVCELEKHVILCFTNDNRPALNSTIQNKLIDKGFRHIRPEAKIGQFIIKQIFPPIFGQIHSGLSSEISEEWEINTYLCKATQELNSPEDLDFFIRSELESPNYNFVFKGQFYYEQDFQPYVTEYAYLGKGD